MGEKTTVRSSNSNFSMNTHDQKWESTTQNLLIFSFFNIPRKRLTLRGCRSQTSKQTHKDVWGISSGKIIFLSFVWYLEALFVTTVFVINGLWKVGLLLAALLITFQSISSSTVVLAEIKRLLLLYCCCCSFWEWFVTFYWLKCRIGLK